RRRLEGASGERRSRGQGGCRARGERVPFRRLHGARGERAHARQGDRGEAVSWLDEVPWDKDGLIAAVAQDASSKRVLTVAWMNRQALEETAKKQEAVYWSRSRKKLWRKGEESG